eukprot:s1820_g14.t1
MLLQCRLENCGSKALPAIVTAPLQLPLGTLTFPAVTQPQEAIPMSPVDSVRPVPGTVWQVTDPAVYPSFHGHGTQLAGPPTRHRRARNPRLHPGTGARRV